MALLLSECFPDQHGYLMNTYCAIGLMSGSSLDGLDIAMVELVEDQGRWTYTWIAAECIPYTPEWMHSLSHARELDLCGFLRLHTAYGHFLGKQVAGFLNRHPNKEPIDFIASHGHTIYHDPEQGTSFQLGDGAAIARETGLSVISDLRNMDIAYGGQGAPIVPMGDQCLFPDYHFWLNLGGIANMTFREYRHWRAFDIAACNQVLNALAKELGQEYDDGGNLAASGKNSTALLEALNDLDYYKKPLPKSLDNSFTSLELLPLFKDFDIPVVDQLHTYVTHVVQQISDCLTTANHHQRLLATGGGALNNYLIARLSAELRQKDIEVVVPDLQTIQFKEALIMALLGALRIQGKPGVLCSVTGAVQDSIAGALWLGN